MSKSSAKTGIKVKAGLILTISSFLLATGCETKPEEAPPLVLESGDEGVGDYESWGVTRTVTLKFLADDPSSAAGASWNHTVTGGEYTERVQGLIGQGKPIVTKGIFRLSKVNDTQSLTTEVIH